MDSVAEAGHTEMPAGWHFAPSRRAALMNHDDLPPAAAATICSRRVALKPVDVGKSRRQSPVKRQRDHGTDCSDALSVPVMGHSRENTRRPAIAEGPRDASCQLKSCQLPRNSAEILVRQVPNQVSAVAN